MQDYYDRKGGGTHIVDGSGSSKPFRLNSVMKLLNVKTDPDNNHFKYSHPLLPESIRYSHFLLPQYIENSITLLCLSK